MNRHLLTPIIGAGLGRGRVRTWRHACPELHHSAAPGDDVNLCDRPYNSEFNDDQPYDTVIRGSLNDRPHDPSHYSADSPMWPHRRPGRDYRSRRDVQPGWLPVVRRRRFD